MILSHLAAAFVGAAIVYLVLRNNPKLAAKVAGIVDDIDDKLDKKNKK